MLIISPGKKASYGDDKEEDHFSGEENLDDPDNLVEIIEPYMSDEEEQKSLLNVLSLLLFI